MQSGSSEHKQLMVPAAAVQALTAALQLFAELTGQPHAFPGTAVTTLATGDLITVVLNLLEQMEQEVEASRAGNDRRRLSRVAGNTAGGSGGGPGRAG